MMKNFLFVLPIFLILISSCEKSGDSPSGNMPDTISLSLGNYYANDIYYKLDSGIVATVPRTEWDIAFHTNAFSSTILTNGGSGVLLYEFTADTTKWMTSLDTTGLYTHEKLYNSDTTWTLGAFERTATVHPDYGWGKYNDLNHDIIGNKIFVIKLENGQYKKIWIYRKYSTLNTYKIKFANINDIDGSSEVIATIDCSPYTSKNFVYYSISTSSIVDREPRSNAWDLLFTKYVEIVPMGATNVPYIVTGVLSNTMRLSTMGNVSYSGVMTSQLDNTNHTVTDYSLAPFKSSISLIGSDWKTINMSNYTYDLKDNVIYFVKNTKNDIYRVVFLTFEGASTGNLSFEERKVN